MLMAVAGCVFVTVGPYDYDFTWTVLDECCPCEACKLGYHCGQCVECDVYCTPVEKCQCYIGSVQSLLVVETDRNN